ncbi:MULTISPECIES: acyl-CoA dehydrogenase family protein [Thermomonospora]|uniref:Acyl-CoA dehydrogenase domain protein n=1 Tax=Thermomonospora curvata (strain ATCC 19995 / DSM 43183 / JCM 3096 / KCTC 9072 / NBRC 15933 / NCIMB 10081 / Henssen B9) TaxID=471852 RepID=D1A636_THECD|nr:MULTISPECIES: acyl-CoA dehydrogenase family protein [Thermomonospora]ACZ00135.1 acyl-CoA dehydrogenase domain protein [Thermomonospora curvata DSM 43183]PKK11953.1 MAG: acyl-CoA dehydrogenase [Thermomonospora sp. CIF 1]
MDLTYTPEEEAFRAEVRAWLEANVPAEPLPSLDTPEGFAAHQEWERKLYEARLSVVTWPKEYGGRGASLAEWLIFEEEYYRAGAPARVGQNGIFLLAPSLFEFGTEEQRKRFLPPMASGEHVWAQGWSEPEAGSDLAAVRSRAVRTDGGWLLSGQKTWSSRAAYAHWLFGLFRTDPDSVRHHGLTYFLVPLDAEGVTVRGIKQLDGEPGFAEVFFDEVFVPDDQVLGGVGKGWQVAMSTTGSERGLTLRSPGRFMAAADRLVALARETEGLGEAERLEVARAWMNADAYRLYTFQTLTRVQDGQSIGPESSINKIFWSEMDLHLHQTALRLLGARGELTGQAPDAVAGGRWLDGFLFALSGPIYGGTNEIQRNIIAERVLGMPREPRPVTKEAK